MTKTKELEDRCIQGLIDADKLTVLDADNVMTSSVEAQVTLGTVLFQSPSADFGRVTHVAIPKPTAPLVDVLAAENGCNRVA